MCRSVPTLTDWVSFFKNNFKDFHQPHEVSRKIHALYYFQDKIKKSLSSPREDINFFLSPPPLFCQWHVSPFHKRGGGGERKRAVLLLFMQIDGWKDFQLHLPTVLPFQFLVTSSPLLTFSFTWLHHLLRLTDGGFYLSIPDLSTAFTKQTTIIISMLTLLKTSNFKFFSSLTSRI